jgi:hypothetical protein
MLRKYYWVSSTILLMKTIIIYMFFETNGVTFHQLIARGNVIIYGDILLALLDFFPFITSYG